RGLPHAGRPGGRHVLVHRTFRGERRRSLVGVAVKTRATLKTYSHLASERRMPSEYEIATSRLLWYVPRGGFEVNVPLAAWYQRWQRESPFTGADWERFRDPRETTYTA